jgi:aspartyl/asparaginyl-tRNA synthetase
VATRVRHSLAEAIHRFFDENGFFWVNTPIITASDAEGLCTINAYIRNRINPATREIRICDLGNN